MVITKNKGTKTNKNSFVYCCFICNSLKHNIYDYIHKSMAWKMFRDKASHAKLKKDETAINMVLIVTTKSQNLKLVLSQAKEPQNTKTIEDWGKNNNYKRPLDWSSNKCKIFLSSQPTLPQHPPFNVSLVAINLHVAIIQVHMGKNIVEDVLLDGGLGVNIITKTFD